MFKIIKVCLFIIIKSLNVFHRNFLLKIVGKVCIFNTKKTSKVNLKNVLNSYKFNIEEINKKMRLTYHLKYC